MQAKETRLKFLLEGKRQYAVPLYQRRYAWKQKEWQTLWLAIKRQYDIVEQGGSQIERPTHFFGSLVVHPTSEQASGLATYNIIDGQQRLTTVIAVLTALRDLWDDDEAKERLHETYLVNKWEKGDGNLKLLPGKHDRADIKALASGDPDKAVGSIGSAYRWFRNQIELLANDARGVDYDALERTIITRLEVVDVTTDAKDNAHRIFQTLNSTGLGLSQVDLLRNHFFMLLPTLADDAYEEHWNPMESSLGSWVDLFLWVETVSRGEGREVTPRDQVYTQWQNDLADIEYDESAVFEQMTSLARKTEAYVQMIAPDQVTDAKLQLRLSRLKEWGATVYHPVALQAMTLRQDGVIGDAEAAQALLYIESFLVRRMLAGIPTNNLNRIFTTVAGQVKGKVAFADSVRAALSTAGKYWPTDLELSTGISTEHFYLNPELLTW